MAQLKTNLTEIVSTLKSLANPDTLGFMAKYGITPDLAYGVKIPELRRIAKSYRNNHELALALWNHNTRETRILATMVDDPKQLTEKHFTESLLIYAMSQLKLHISHK